MDSKIRSVISNLRGSQIRRLERSRASENQSSSSTPPTNRNTDRAARPNRPAPRTDTTLLDIHDRFDLPKPSDPPFGGRTGPVAIPINPNGPGADNFIPPHEYYEHIQEQADNWRGEPAASGKTAPQYVIFELASGYAGDSGKLAEMKPGSRINTATLDSSQIQVDADGRFEILIAPEKPEGYSGNFLLSKRSSHGTDYVGRYLTCRELFHDWENQDVIDLEILRIGCEREPRAPIEPQGAVELMQEIGRIAKNQVHSWNAFNAVNLGTYGKIPGGISDQMGLEGPFMPVNDMNPPNALGLATGGGQSSNIYAGGTFLLGDDEALIIETTTPVQPAFLGFHLANLWGESLDFESYPSNINAHFMEPDPDGSWRWVVSHKDPGVANWVSTTGIPHGYTSMRWTYPEPPPKEQWPTLSCKKVAFSEIENALPHARKVTEDERAAQRLIRHRHVQRRYRQY